MSLKLRPLADRVVVKPVERDEMTKSGILLPDTAKEKPQEGIIEAVGNGRYNEQTGVRVALDVKVGDRVMYAKYAGSEVKIDDVEYLILGEKDILAVVEKNGKKSRQGMPAKQLRFEAPARAALARGAAIVADTVAVTLGPRGRTVVLDKKFGPPLISNDGVTIARELELEDHFENMGAQLLKEVAIKTNDIAGDGTTTATVLARSMLDEGLRNLAAGAPPNELRRGMMAACDAAVASIRARSHPVKGGDDILRVATISSGDAAIGAMISDAFDKVGKEGVVSVEDGTGIETEVEVVEGMQFDRGYISAHLVTDLQNMESVLSDARVLVTDAKISSVADLLPSLELVMRAGRPLLIVAEDVQAEALATLVVNRARGTFSRHGGQGTRVRRASRRDPPGHRGAHRRDRHQREDRSAPRRRP